MKYRKLPLEVEAIQFIGTNLKELADFCGPEAFYNTPADSAYAANQVFLRTLEGSMRIDVNSWVIKGIKGEFYSCKPDIFEASYEPANAH